MKLFRFWVYSNLHIALIAAALSLETNVLLDVEPLFAAPVFIFFGTLLVYNLGYFPSVFSTKTPHRRQARWLKAHTAYWGFSILVASIGFFYSITQFSLTGQLLIAALGILTLVYVMHDIRLPGIRISVRNVPYLKVFIVAFTWAGITILPQLSGNTEDFLSPAWILLFFERFFFILSITLMFDVRDMYQDPEKLRTFPQKLGIGRTKWLAIFFLGMALFFLLNIELSLYSLAAELGVYALTLWMIRKSRPGLDDIFFTGWFDGVMGLHALAIILPVFLQ